MEVTAIVPAAVRVAPLYQELNRWQRLPFAWGEADCCLMLADWILRVTGRDPAAHLRGLYETAAECQRLTGFLTDPVACFEGCFATIGGLPRRADPLPGDVAVYRRADERWPFGGVWTGQRWASKGRDGVTLLKPGYVGALAIWGVGYAV